MFIHLRIWYFSDYTKDKLYFYIINRPWWLGNKTLKVCQCVYCISFHLKQLIYVYIHISIYSNKQHIHKLSQITAVCIPESQYCSSFTVLCLVCLNLVFLYFFLSFLLEERGWSNVKYRKLTLYTYTHTQISTLICDLYYTYNDRAGKQNKITFVFNFVRFVSPCS